MKNILKLGSIAFLCALWIACKKEKKPLEAENSKYEGYVVKGDFKNAKNGTLVLAYYDGIKQKRIGLDSAQINSGKFEMKGKIGDPMKVFCTVLPDSCTFNLWLENSKITVTGDVHKSKTNKWGGGFKTLPVVIKGGKIQAEADAYEELFVPLKKKQAPFLLAYDKANNALIEAMKAKKDEQILARLKAKAEKAHEQLEPFGEQFEAIENNYMQMHPQSFVTASLLSYSMGRMKPEKSEAMYNKLSEQVKNAPLGKSIKAGIEKMKSGFPGQSAFVFSAMDIKGKAISLSDYTGKYVLLDFWASWCAPCRAGNPHLITLYKKYHEKGIEFISIADDDHNPKAWYKAVKKDKIGIWEHVLDGKKPTATGYDISHSISEHYGISSIPTQILINPEAVIIGRYGSPGDPHEDLDKKLKELFGT